MPSDAFSATYSDWKLIRTRAVVQIVLEVPVEDADHAYNVLGGMPNSAREIWVGVARFKPGTEVVQNSGQLSADKSPPAPEDSTTPTRARTPWHEKKPAEQAGILCSDRMFWAFLSTNNYGPAWSAEDAATIVRRVCKVKTRSDIVEGDKANDYWMDLVSKYRTWQLAAQVVPA